MTDVQERPVLLLAACRLKSAVPCSKRWNKAGKLVKRVPDGETGARKDWVVSPRWIQGRKGPRARQHTENSEWRQIHPLQSETRGNGQIRSTGICAAAIRSYEDFNGLALKARYRQDPAFKSSLAYSVAVVMTFSDPRRSKIWPIYAKRLNEEVAGIRRRPFRTGSRHPVGTLLPKSASCWKIGNGEGDSNGCAGRGDCTG